MVETLKCKLKRATNAHFATCRFKHNIEQWKPQLELNIKKQLGRSPGWASIPIPAVCLHTRGLGARGGSQLCSTAASVWGQVRQHSSPPRWSCSRGLELCARREAHTINVEQLLPYFDRQNPAHPFPVAWLRCLPFQGQLPLGISQVVTPSVLHVSTDDLVLGID